MRTLSDVPPTTETNGITIYHLKFYCGNKKMRSKILGFLPRVKVPVRRVSQVVHSGGIFATRSNVSATHRLTVTVTSSHVITINTPSSIVTTTPTTAPIVSCNRRFIYPNFRSTRLRFFRASINSSPCVLVSVNASRTTLIRRTLRFSRSLPSST